MRHVYSGPVDPPEPCCTEEPDHKDLGWPKPDIDTIMADLSPKDVRALAKAAVLIMADLGSESTLRNPAEHCAVITDILSDADPGNLPTFAEQSKPAARWWAKVGDVDVHDDDKWTPEEDDE